MVKYKIPEIELEDDLNGEILDLEKTIDAINSRRDTGLSDQVSKILERNYK